MKVNGFKKSKDVPAEPGGGGGGSGTTADDIQRKCSSQRNVEENEAVVTFFVCHPEPRRGRGIPCELAEGIPRCLPGSE